MEKLEMLLERLAQLIAEKPGCCHFNAGASVDQIAALENYIKRPLPDAYRIFLLFYNGGFMRPEPIKKSDTDALESAAWNANTLLGIEEIGAHYDRIEYKFMHADMAFVPFCHTDNQELLVFAAQEEPYADSPVYDAWHEVGPYDWLEQKLYDSFTDFLEDYIAKSGLIETIG